MIEIYEFGVLTLHVYGSDITKHTATTTTRTAILEVLFLMSSWSTIAVTMVSTITIYKYSTKG